MGRTSSFEQKDMCPTLSDQKYFSQWRTTNNLNLLPPNPNQCNTGKYQLAHYSAFMANPTKNMNFFLQFWKWYICVCGSTLYAFLCFGWRGASGALLCHCHCVHMGVGVHVHLLAHLPVIERVNSCA